MKAIYLTAEPEAPTEETPTLLDSLRMALSAAGNYAAKFVALAGAALLTLSIIWIVAEQIEFWFADNHTEITETRDFLCNEHVFKLPENATPDDAQKILIEIYGFKERARQHAIPFDSVGRIQYFLRCASIREVTPTSVAFQIQRSERNQASNDAAALVALENYYFDIVDQNYRDMVPGVLLGNWRTRLDTLETYVAENLTPPETKVAGQDAQPDEILGLVPPSTEAAFQDKWLLVVAADQDDAAALHEVKKLRTALGEQYKDPGPIDPDTGKPTGTAKIVGFSADSGDVTKAVSLFTIRSWKRTVAPFNTRADAEKALRLLLAAEKIRYDSYVREVRSWCSADFAKRSADDFSTVLQGVPIFLCTR